MYECSRETRHTTTMTALTDTPAVGQYGTDSGHDFEVLEVADAETKIGYGNGRTAWFQTNRFEQDQNGRLTLQ